MKRVINFVIIAVCLISLLGGISANAKTATAVTAESVQINEHDTFNVNITVNNNAGINSLRLYVEYNPEHFELISAEDKQLFGKGATTSKKLDDLPYVFFWSNIGKENATQNGILATLTFKAKNLNFEAQSAYPIKIFFKNKNDCINTDLQAVDVELRSCEVTKINDIPSDSVQSDVSSAPQSLDSETVSSAVSQNQGVLSGNKDISSSEAVSSAYIGSVSGVSSNDSGSAEFSSKTSIQSGGFGSNIQTEQESGENQTDINSEIPLKQNKNLKIILIALPVLALISAIVIIYKKMS